MIGGGRFAILRSAVVKIRAIKSGNLKSFGRFAVTSSKNIWFTIVVISSKAEGVTTANEIRQVSHIGEKERTGRIAQKRV